MSVLNSQNLSGTITIRTSEKKVKLGFLNWNLIFLK